MRETVRRCLAWGVLSSLLLPMVVAIVTGLAALLASLGDRPGATACGRVALVLGACWVVALAATATAGGILTLERIDADAAAAERPSGRRGPHPGDDERTGGD
jgi:hypothetical protein